MKQRTEKMPDIAFRIMEAIFNIMDVFSPPGKRLDNFGIKKGFVVVDYGCGPGRHIKRASELAGENGKVYAVDIHELAVRSVEKKIEKYGLKNVSPGIIEGYNSGISNKSADLIYALDMFHMIRNTGEFLREFHRVLKGDGRLILEDGHQPREAARKKVNNSGLWKIVKENKEYLECIPV